MERNDEPPREWTAEEDEALRGLWPTHGKSWPGWETRLPGRTPHALESRARRLGLRRAAVPWTRRQLLCLSGCLREAAAACGHEPAECVRMLQVMARMWEVSRGTRRGPYASLSEHELAELLADRRGGTSEVALARRHGVSDRTVRRWVDEACVLEALRHAVAAGEL